MRVYWAAQLGKFNIARFFGLRLCCALSICLACSATDAKSLGRPAYRNGVAWLEHLAPFPFLSSARYVASFSYIEQLSDQTQASDANRSGSASDKKSPDQHWEMLGVWATVIATLLSGMATLAAVLFALTMQRRLERRTRPKLRVEHSHSSQGDNRYLSPSAVEMGGPGPNRHEVWIRVRVVNRSIYPAKDVELRFISSRTANSYTVSNRPSWWFKVSNLNPVAVTIPAHFSQHFDIAYLVRETGGQEPRAFLALIQPGVTDWDAQKAKIESYGDYTRLPIGWHHDLFFAVVGSNCDAVYYRMPVHLSPPRSAAISEKEMRDCITVGDPTVVSADIAFSDSPD